MKIIVCLALLLVSFCSFAGYKEPAPTDQAATLALSRTENSLMFGGGQMFSLFDNDQCKKSGRSTGRLHGFSPFNKKPKSLRIPAGRPVYLRAHTIGVSEVRGSEVVQSACANVVTFTPVVGHTYSASQSPVVGGCEISIVDNVTSLSPPDLQRVAVVESCAP